MWRASPFCKNDLHMNKIASSILTDVGLIGWPPFIKDRLFVAALFSGLLVWLALWLTVAPTFSLEGSSVTKIIFLTVIWHPVLEEIFFRGVIQGALFNKSWGNKYFAALSAANWLTSLLFVLAHLFYQPWIWAVSVIFPSVVYGYFRDKYESIYPCIVLHALYNAGFVAINIISQ